MKHEKKIIFGIVFKMTKHPRVNQLRPNCEKYESKARKGEKSNEVNLD